MMGELLVTGAGGGVATMLRPMLRERYGQLILSDRREIGDLQAGESFRPCDLADRKQVAAMLKDVDRVIHLGGMSLEADWETIMQANIVGLHNLYEGCHVARVKRVIFASSNHTIGFYGRNRRLTVDHRIRPDSRYGVSKVFGEAVASLYADKHGIGTLSIRIGNIALEPPNLRGLSIWLHPEDFLQLCAIGLEHPAIHSQVVWGISDCARAWWDNQPAHELGYRPKYRAENHAPEVLQVQETRDPVGDLFQGGDFCSPEFTGDAEGAYQS